MMKMNVMHMFLSELCFRVESKVFPDLVNNGGKGCTGPNPRPGLVNNGYYTQADIARLVEYAKRRGIRIIPEFECDPRPFLCAWSSHYCNHSIIIVYHYHLINFIII